MPVGRVFNGARAMKLGTIEFTDFDIGVGWQTWGNYRSIRSWVIGFFHNQGPDEPTRENMVMIIFTILGFYVRIYLFNPRRMGHPANTSLKGNSQ